jgi:hypothetical protein
MGIGVTQEREAAFLVAEPTLAFLAPRIETKNSDLTGVVSNVVNAMVEYVDHSLRALVSKPRIDDFREASAATFANYARTVLALSKFARTAVPNEVAVAICNQNLLELEETFQEKGASAFGREVTEQATFTIWSFRQTNELIARFISHPVLSLGKYDQDTTISTEYLKFGLWSQFSLDCLARALIYDIPAHPDIVVDLSHGLRAAVDAYAWARQAYDLRFPEPTEPVRLPSAMEAEDELWLRVPRANVRDASSDAERETG